MTRVNQLSRAKVLRPRPGSSLPARIPSSRVCEFFQRRKFNFLSFTVRNEE